MPEIDEFDLIWRLFVPLARHPGALGLTDDAALVAPPAGHQLAMTTDALVAGVHFLADDPPAAIARKALRVNLSDLAAMGAQPIGFLLATAFPPGADVAWLDAFAAGLREDLDAFAVSIFGGDTVSTPGPFVLSVTAFGYVEIGRELRRSTARSGDRVWVSGTIGDAALGLFVARGAAGGLDSAAAAALLDRYRLPRPRVALGRALQGVASAAMDVSDGLIGDLGHICRASGVGAVIETGRVPLSRAARAALAHGVGDGLETALTGGDDYELLFTAPASASRAIGEIAARLDLPLTEIGCVTGEQGVCVIAPDGGKMGLATTSFRHFRDRR